MSEIKGYIETPFHGESAYEIALRHGYEGTEEDWLNSLGFIPDKSIGKEKLSDEVIELIQDNLLKDELFNTETIVIPAKEASPNLLNPEEIVEGKSAAWSTTSNNWYVSSGDAKSYVIIPVTPGHKYKGIKASGSEYAGINVMWASGTEASLEALTYISSSTGYCFLPAEEYDKGLAYVEAPEGATHLIFNNNRINHMLYDYTEHGLLTQWVEYGEEQPETTEEIYKIKEELLPDLGIDKIQEKAASNEKKIAEVEAAKADAEVWEDIVCEWAGGSGYNYDGTLYTPKSDDEYIWGKIMSQYMSYTPKDAPIEVNEGEVWKTKLSMTLRIQSHSTGIAIATLAPIVICDENDNVIWTKNSESGVAEIEFEIPAGGKKMYLTYYNSQPFTLQKKVVMSMSNIAQKDLEATKAQLKTQLDAHYRLYRRNRPTLQQSDKAYVIFVVDDLKDCVSTYADMFIERGLPLCLAVPPENLRQAALNGTESRKQVAKRVVAAGGEVLTHHGKALTVENFNFDEAYNSFVISKEMLEKEGFEVNGTILVGGQTVEDIEALRPEMEKWTSFLYKYSDRCGVAEPYWHARVGMYPAYLPYEQYQAKLATAIENKELIVFYWHDADNISDEDLAKYLDYFKSLSADDIEAVTYKEYYDKVLYN